MTTEKKYGDEIIEEALVDAHAKACPNQAFDPATIMALVTGFIQVIRGCRNQDAAASHLRRGSNQVRNKMRRNLMKEGYNRSEAVEIAEAMAEKGRNLSDSEMAAIMDDAVDEPEPPPAEGQFWPRWDGAARMLLIFAVFFCTTAVAQDKPTSFWPKDVEQDNRLAVHDAQISDLQSEVRQISQSLKTVVEKLDELKPSETLVKTDAAQAPPPPVEQNTVSEWYTQDELVRWVKARYTPTTRLQHAVMADDNQVWLHLVQGAGDHEAFRPSQINGMERWVALALHDAAHAKQISPRRSIPDPAPVIAAGDPPTSSPVGGGVPVSISGRWMYWTSGGRRWNNQGWGVRDGQIYSGGGSRFQYRNGLMYALSSTSAATRVQSTQMPILRYAAGNYNCSNGNCYRGF